MKAKSVVIQAYRKMPSGGVSSCKGLTIPKVFFPIQRSCQPNVCPSVSKIFQSSNHRNRIDPILFKIDFLSKSQGTVFLVFDINVSGRLYKILTFLSLAISHPKGNPQENPKGNPQENLKENPKENPQENPKGNPQENLKKNPKGNPQENPKGNP